MQQKINTHNDNEKTWKPSGALVSGRYKEYVHEDDDTLPLKLADGTVNCDNRFMLETGRRATITTD